MERINGYTVLRQLASCTYLCRDQNTGARVVAKHQNTAPFSNELMPDTLARSIIKREFDALNSLVHPNIVEPIDLFEYEGKSYISTRYAGRHTMDYLAHTRQQEALGVAISLSASALQASNEAGILHCDFKPENVAVANQRDRSGKKSLSTKLIDFGAAYDMAAGNFNPSTAIGTPGYASKDYSHGREPSLEDDVFSFCASVYDLITNKLPYPLKETNMGDYVDFDRPCFRPSELTQFGRFGRLVIQGLSLERQGRPAIQELAIAAREQFGKTYKTKSQVVCNGVRASRG